MNGKPRLLLALALAGLAWLAWFFWPRDRQGTPRSEAATSPSPGAPEHMLGEKILAEYNAPAGSIRNDLTWMSRLLQSYRSLVKAPNALPLGSNEEIAAAFRGKNPYRQAFLPASHKAFNRAGQIVDRWGSPLFFHAVAADRVEIRSAGPDRQMWTSDDVQRDADGAFVEGLGASRRP